MLLPLMRDTQQRREFGGDGEGGEVPVLSLSKRTPEDFSGQNELRKTGN